LRLRIEDTTKSSRSVRGFSFGGDMVSVAEPSHQPSSYRELANKLAANGREEWRRKNC
jgi:hypothetical protein